MSGSAVIDFLAALVHPLAVVLIFLGAVGLDLWFLERHRRRDDAELARWWKESVYTRRRSAPPPDTP